MGERRCFAAEAGSYAATTALVGAVGGLCVWCRLVAVAQSRLVAGFMACSFLSHVLLLVLALILVIQCDWQMD
jgi:hypothetical protein